ncbi:hypothetical protein PISMIDRAFT_437336 [Pisolithus microcarpus 441]|uniref:Uncharacterized protein n=1 Tax=Pisolithus microcarpus 441 TaxID=765257 RepID=A0A0C9XJM7_9AGAM|nr:hypothetical protein BKA83DRAFT_437336 [Pisolithus microcarpus]KIK12480.1 hypothetical protein PISMIDRAFT_437336 [Pisolithus microcarpus 441]
MRELHMFLAPKLTTSSFTPTTSNKTGSLHRITTFQKRHLLEYAKPSNSTPSSTLLPGRPEARTGDFPSVLETSGMASTERLATNPRHSFDGSLRGTPATITSEVADTGIGSGVEEQPQVAPPQGATATSTGRGAQGDQEGFRAASPKDAEKSTSKSEPKLDPEAHSTAASDESYELRTQSRKERADVFQHNVTVHSRFETGCTTLLYQCDRWLLHLRIIHSVGVLTYNRMRSTP